MGGEQYKKSHEYKELDPREVAELESVAHEKRAEQLESRSPERSIEKGHERERALELANSMERRDTDKNERESRAHDSPAERRRHTPNTKERDVAYHSIMDNARTHMSPVERTFSKVIHNRGVEAVTIDRDAAAAQRVLGQVVGETVGVVELERGLTV